jgi:pantoate--beta-alanine ligase
MALRIIRKVSDLDLNPAFSVGFVPTMGAFHEGHLELMRQAKRESDICVVSLFVNPTQFGPGEDYGKYPRQENSDFEMARSAGADVMFAPEVSEIYGEKTTRVHVANVTDRWEGEKRPGHFEGVATVVAILFNIVQPTRAYFGLKDFQQCALIRRMVEDLRYRIELRFVETIREEDGLAMSSRNAYLSPEERKTAPQLYRTLQGAAEELRQSAKDPMKTEGILGRHRETLKTSGFAVDYFALVDGVTLEPLEYVQEGGRMIAAAYLNATRLIDNCPV